VRVRSLLIVTALLSSVLGAVAGYLALTVPNDVQASTLLRQARKEIEAGQNDQARQSLSKIVQEYPRTDAAAAATVALVTLAEQERQDLQKTIIQLRHTTDAQQKQITDLSQKVDVLSKPPPPPPPAPVQVAAKPAPKPAPKPAKKPAKKPAHHRTRPKRHR
jgi:hypothetical protein